MNQLLCFIRNNFDKWTTAELKVVLLNFYNDDELVAGKELLLKVVTLIAKDTAGETDLPRLPRRQGENKGRQTLEDILKLFIIVDERKWMDSLPCFVAADLSRVPQLNADSVNVLHLAKQIESLELRFAGLDTKVDILAKTTPHPSAFDGLSRDVPQSSDSSDTSCQPSDITADHGEQWVTVARRRSYRSGNGVVKSGLSPQSSTGQPSQDTRRPSHSTVNNRKLLGTRQSSDTTVKSGVPIIQKSVIHVDNLHPGCTVALLTDYLLAADINVLTCHASKSWLREDEREKVTAFRVCVPASQRQKMFNPQLWSEGVVIRDWKFKKSNHGAGVNA